MREDSSDLRCPRSPCNSNAPRFVETTTTAPTLAVVRRAKRFWLSVVERVAFGQTFENCLYQFERGVGRQAMDNRAKCRLDGGTGAGGYGVKRGRRIDLKRSELVFTMEDRLESSFRFRALDLG